MNSRWDDSAARDLSDLDLLVYASRLIGAEKTLNDVWTVRGGLFWDETPAPPASVSPLLPDADRNGFCLGGTWKSGSWRIDAASWFVLSRARSTAGVSRDSFEGIYKSHAFTLGVFVGYVF